MQKAPMVKVLGATTTSSFSFPFLSIVTAVATGWAGYAKRETLGINVADFYRSVHFLSPKQHVKAQKAFSQNKRNKWMN